LNARYAASEILTKGPIIQRVMSADLNVPQVGMKAPEFFIDTADGRRSLHQLAARHGNLVLTSQDSYRYHPN